MWDLHPDIPSHQLIVQAVEPQPAWARGGREGGGREDLGRRA